MKQPAISAYQFDHFYLDLTKRLLWRDGEVVSLQARDFDLLLALIARRGQVVSKEELLRQVWQDRCVEEGNLSIHIFALRRALGETPDDHRYIVTFPGQGYSFVAAVREATDESFTNAPALPSSIAALDTSYPMLESVGGAIPLASPFYIERPTDREFNAAVQRRASIVFIKGARQVGKTSLLARSLQQARAAGARVVLTDFQLLNAAHLASIEALLLALAKTIADQLELEILPQQLWDTDLGPSMNFTRYVRREALGRDPAPLVWGMDEVDRLFTYPFGSEVFGLFRSWHNARSLDPAGPWPRLTLAMAYATEAHLFITDVHHSPFNVGTRLTLEDFTLAEVAELNRRYGAPLSQPEVERLYRLVCGHPYLVRRALHEVTARGSCLDDLEAQAGRDEGPFGDHLRRLLISLNQDAALRDVVRGVIGEQACPSAESFYRLRSAGVVVGDAAREAKMRCRLYSTYLQQHLL